MRSRYRVGLSAIFMSFILVFAFQNCGQNGSIASSADSLGKINGADPLVAADNLEVVIPTPPQPQNLIPPQNPVDIKDPVVEKEPVIENNEPPLEDDTQDVALEDAVGSCKKIDVSQVNLAIDHISLPGGMIVLAAEGDNLVISDTKKTIKMKALADASLSQIRLVLKDEGNFLASSENLKYDLKTPSAQQSGIKVHLDQVVDVKKDSMYELTVEVNLSVQIVGNKSKCLFKPVIKSASLL